jgi:hypothetical protein
MNTAEKKSYKVAHNFTHVGHYMEPRVTIDVPEDKLRDRLKYIIEDVSRSCRIWVDGRLSWVYDGGNSVNPNPKSADEVLHELGLHHLVGTAVPVPTTAATGPKF